MDHVRERIRLLRQRKGKVIVGLAGPLAFGIKRWVWPMIQFGGDLDFLAHAATWRIWRVIGEFIASYWDAGALVAGFAWLGILVLRPPTESERTDDAYPVNPEPAALDNKLSTRPTAPVTDAGIAGRTKVWWKAAGQKSYSVLHGLMPKIADAVPDIDAATKFAAGRFHGLLMAAFKDLDAVLKVPDASTASDVDAALDRWVTCYLSSVRFTTLLSRQIPGGWKDKKAYTEWRIAHERAGTQLFELLVSHSLVRTDGSATGKWSDDIVHFNLASGDQG